MKPTYGTIYWQGDKVELTGAVENHHGADWHMAKLLEGHRKGEIISLSKEHLEAYQKEPLPDIRIGTKKKYDLGQDTWMGYASTYENNKKIDTIWSDIHATNRVDAKLDACKLRVQIFEENGIYDY